MNKVIQVTRQFYFKWEKFKSPVPDGLVRR